MQVSHEHVGAGIAFRFDHKPAELIRSALKQNGFRWSPSSGYWWRARAGQWADLLAWVRDNLTGKPSRYPAGACWKCGDANGYFRNRGAAAPVWCDKCAAEVEAAEAARSGPDRFDMAYEDSCRDACGL